MNKAIVLAVAAVAMSAVSASAADMPVKAVYKAPPPVYFSWTGCYIGAHVGGGWGTKRWSDPALAGIEFSRHDISGVVGGGQVGCDVQTSNWVFGVEASFSGSNLNGDSIDALSAGTLRDRTRVDFLGTFTGRIGMAFDHALLYVKGGGAVARDRFSAIVIPAGTLFYAADDTRWGWLIGAGIEYAFGGAWSAKAEYNYMDFGTRRENFVGGAFVGVAPFDINQRVQVLKVGLNWRFGGPVMAAY